MKCHTFKEDPCWEHKCACKEDHTHTVQEYFYTTTITCVSAFNMPKKGEELTLQLDSVVSISPGVVLWSPAVGYLHVKTFDKETSTVVVENRDEEGNKYIGSAIVANQKFTVGIPFTVKANSSTTSSAILLASDFVSPESGACSTASVTSIDGLSVGQDVSIQGYVYRVGAIIDTGAVTLCNDGKGAPAGHVFSFDPYKCGEPSIPVVAFSKSACENTSVHAGKLVACNEGVTTTLNGEEDGQVLVWETATESWRLKNANVAETCTSLSACFIVDTTEDTSYLINVINTGIFSQDNKVLIDGNKYIVDEIVDATHMRVTPETTPTEFRSIPRSTPVCLEGCCEWVPKKLADTIDDESWRPSALSVLSVSGSQYAEKISGIEDLKETDDSVSVETETITVTNISKVSSCVVLARLYSESHGRVIPQAATTIEEAINHRCALRLNNSLTYTITEYTANTTQNDGETTYSSEDKVNVSTRTVRSTTIPKLPRNSSSDDSETANRVPEHMAMSQEIAYILPPYDEKKPYQNKIVFKGETKLSLLSGSTTDFTFPTTSTEQKESGIRGGVTANLIVEAHLI